MIYLKWERKTRLCCINHCASSRRNGRISRRATAFAVFKYQLSLGASDQSARNTTLLLMVLFENVHVLNSRSETRSIFRQYFFGNKFLLFGMLGAQSIHIAAMYTPIIRDTLQLQPVTFNLWLTLLGIALILIVLDECHKLLRSP